MYFILFFILYGNTFANIPQSFSKRVSDGLIPGAERAKLYLPLLKNKRVGIVTNQTGQVRDRHLVDFLIASKIQLMRIFSPEHGFRGTASAGETVNNQKDPKTGLSIISLYGKNKKPSTAQLKDIDLMVFDLQDVGVRCYTYISTLTYMMEACAKQRISLIVLDRPNPNGHYINGPVLQPKLSSFVGLHPVPIVYGMTIGEYAQMVHGEGWLPLGTPPLDLKVIPLKNYDHKMPYTLPVAPSPNLPNDQAIRLYPSLCLFEGTQVSIGRGTDFPFQVYGAPYFDRDIYYFSFTPHSKVGEKNPTFNGKKCYGYDLRSPKKTKRLHLNWLIKAHQEATRSKTTFFTPFFQKLAGTGSLQQQIEQGLSEDQIRASWQEELDAFKRIRKKYLLYRDF